MDSNDIVISGQYIYIYIYIYIHLFIFNFILVYMHAVEWCASSKILWMDHSENIVAFFMKCCPLIVVMYIRVHMHFLMWLIVYWIFLQYL
jgi:hypothetical protein